MNENRLSEYLLKTQDALKWSEEDIARRMNISSERWTQIKAGKKNVSLFEFTSLANSLDVDVEDLYFQRLSLDELYRKLKVGVEGFLPERYSIGCFSRMRTAKSLLDAVFFSLRK